MHANPRAPLSAAIRSRYALTGVAGVSTLLCAATGNAFEWSYAPSADIGVSQETNIYMQANDDTTRTGGATVNAAAEIAARKEALTLSFVPRVTALRYDVNDALNRNNTTLDIGVEKQGEHQQWSVNTNYVKEGTLQSDFEQIGIDRVDVDTERAALTAGWVRQAKRGVYNVQASTSAVYYDDTTASP